MDKKDTFCESNRGRQELKSNSIRASSTEKLFQQGPTRNDLCDVLKCRSFDKTFHEMVKRSYIQFVYNDFARLSCPPRFLSSMMSAWSVSIQSNLYRQRRCQSGQERSLIWKDTWFIYSGRLWECYTLTFTCIKFIQFHDDEAPSTSTQYCRLFRIDRQA